MSKRMWSGIFIATLALTLILSGCPADDGGGGDKPDRTVDIVVVGSGLAGSVAAISAMDANPALKVLLIEKQSYYGGTSRLAGGGFSQLEAKEKPSEFDANWKAHALVPAGFPFPDYTKLYSVAQDISATVSYLQSLGVQFNTFEDRPPPRLKYAPATGGGAALMAKLEEIVESKGIEVLMECKAEKLLLSGNAVNGVDATYKGQKFTIRAKNVILAAGGFSQNPELVAKWDGGIEGLRDAIPGTDPGATGDGILMALEAGAVLYNISGTPSTFTDLSGLSFAPAVATVSGSSSLRGNPALSYQIVVDSRGERFTDENQPVGNSAYNNVIHDMVVHGRGPYYIIYDSDNTGANTATLDAIVAAAPAEAFKENTITALATAIGAVNLAATVTAYNTDPTDAQGKSSSFVQALATGPYYALKVYASTLGSMGGVITDDTGRVLKAGGSPIPHLYAIGETSNRDFYGQSYIGGGSLSLYSTMGRRAGKTAAADK